ncbi:MAG: hypothetical protein ETSY2_37875 [Candidatus Entotheonella gemina]|uniref:Uncharacterized protein n=1 Tax=Candidatus Entotheonella gemina TaxID=1429439 RepID=W4LSY7_9BACT|nr:MAG: hypothetical protein ETSY2_37875 [Candidatus Entotheonella gemina]
MTFFDMALPLLSQGPEDLSQVLSQLLVKRPATVLWDKDDVVSEDQH